jgi:hypothetical protein
MSLVGFLSSKTLQIYFSTSAFLTRGSPSVSFEFFLWNKRKSYCKQCFINVRHEECGGGNFEGHIYSVERMYGINIFLISRLDLLVQPCFPYPMGRRFQWKESPLIYTAVQAPEYRKVRFQNILLKKTSGYLCDNIILCSFIWFRVGSVCQQYICNWRILCSPLDSDL